MKKLTRISFADIESKVPAEPGIYEIHTFDGQALKVGISANIRRRLLQHRASKQKYLRLRSGGAWSNPADVVSKRSILAKHLFFAAAQKKYDLKTEQGRQQFLLNECYILFCITSSREEARELERTSEQAGLFKYVGRAINEGTQN